MHVVIFSWGDVALQKSKARAAGRRQLGQRIAGEG
jgi:hypothetical protein